MADQILLATGPLLVPLAIWGVRHRNQIRRRKRLLKDGIHEFNMQYQELLMRWNRRPDSVLTIERRHLEAAEDGNPANGLVDNGSAMAEATLISDVVASPTLPLTGRTNPVVLQPQQQQAQQYQPPRSMAEPTSSGLV
jgi:CHASE1-domain containing sensor protein